MRDELPPEVIAASGRLAERKPHRTIPRVFQEVIDNDNERMAIHAKGAEMTQSDWRRVGALMRDKKTNLRPGAEQALKWNTDKGRPT